MEVKNVEEVESFNKQIQQQIKMAVRNYYDAQDVRIRSGNRLVQSFSQALGQKPGMSKAEMDKEAQKALEQIMEEYHRISDALADDFTRKGDIRKVLESLAGELKVFRNELDVKMVNAYQSNKMIEDEYLKIVKSQVHKHPLWDSFFSKVMGCGELMAGICLTNIDIYAARHASSLWKYAGLDVVFVPDTPKDAENNESAEVSFNEDGVPNISGHWEGRSRKHTVMREYASKATGKTELRKSITFNPELKTKLTGVLGKSFLMTGVTYPRDPKNPKKKLEGAAPIIKPEAKYAKMYFDYRNRLNNNPKYDNHTDKHKHNMANRYIVKMFLVDLWKAWRELEGLPVGPSYAEAYLDKKPHGFNY